ncbi:BCS1 N terminal-domain-containing protein [Annulohypoxylon truncatum]|uniref:BCS1 N terminal-domain-containing protein n=1 Tax=Annulohypoxylon truncatum TaxID=327061 RepID=UPI0020081848|nr:BCS1 N terminal-domain-containing protein [Annulohypoxylon truncatum]KAI1211315.1 BCS1 N terminal-domain-containing protein [Annulohypoxylon truncatum]
MADHLSASCTEGHPSADPAYASSTGAPQLAVLDLFFPGFSMFAGAIQKYLKIDLNLYIPLLLLTGALTVVWNYASNYLWDQLETHFMSVVDIRTDDEVYNIIMSWVARQKFSQGARRFVVNTNINSRCWYIFDWDDDDDEDDGSSGKKKKPLSYTPSFGSHYFWYRGRLLLFRRSAKEQQKGWQLVSQCEEISISCFGRDPWILKELLLEARQQYMQKDEHKTLIYRGTLKPGSMETTWQRCMSRATRPFSTVILNEKVKQELIDDVTDYLDPATQRWYANRGIPYRRGYLLYGPPGTGKSSLSLALAGFFNMRIYIVSLSSITANEENLASLFAELPRRCVVLLEDIDTAGLTHTRDDATQTQSTSSSNDMVPGQLTQGNGDTDKNNSGGRLSLSGLLNILDGVASQEGRILIMTTNHLEKLDAALIRPGRVDITVKFGLADEGMSVSIFRAIFARLDGDEDPSEADNLPTDPEVRSKLEEEKKKKLAIEDARISALAEEFSAKIPTHEFSPAELQGYLMKHKRNPQRAVENVEEFIEQTRKDRKEKQLKEAEEKRKAEAKKKEDLAKKEAEKAKEAEEAQKKEDAENGVDKKATEASKLSSEVTADKKKPAAEEKDTLEVKTESGHVRNDSGYVTPASGEP